MYIKIQNKVLDTDTIVGYEPISREGFYYDSKKALSTNKDLEHPTKEYIQHAVKITFANGSSQEFVTDTADYNETAAENAKNAICSQLDELLEVKNIELPAAKKTK